MECSLLPSVLGPVAALLPSLPYGSSGAGSGFGELLEVFFSSEWGQEADLFSKPELRVCSVPGTMSVVGGWCHHLHYCVVTPLTHNSRRWPPPTASALSRR